MLIKNLGTLLENLPLPLRLVDEENRFAYHNKSFKTLIKGADDKEIYDLWYTKVHSDDINNYLDKIRESISLQKPFQFTYRFLGSDGKYKIFIDDGKPYFTNEKKFKGLIVSTLVLSKEEEIDQTKDNILVLHNALNEVNKKIINAEDKPTLFKEVCEIAVQYTELEIARVSVPDFKTKMFHNIAYYSRTGKGGKYISGHEASIDENHPKGNGPSAISYREKKHVIINDIAADKSFAPWIELAKKVGFHSYGVFPIIYKDTIYGLLVLYAKAKNYFYKGLVDLLSGMTDSVAFALNRIEIQKKQNLTEYSLKKVELGLRQALDNSSQGVWGFNLKTNKLTFSDQCKKMLGYADEKIKMSYGEFVDRVPPEDLKKYYGSIKNYYHGKTEQFESTFRMRHKDGSFRWWLSRGKASEIGKSGTILGLSGSVIDITEMMEKEARVTQLTLFNEALLETYNVILVNDDPEILFDEICRLAVEYGDLLMAWVGIPDFKAKVFSIEAFCSVSEQGDEYIKNLYVSTEKSEAEGCGNVDLALREKKPVIINDTINDKRFSPWKEFAVKIGFSSAGSFPIIFNDNIYGILTLYGRSVNFFSNELIELMGKLADNIAFALNRIAVEKEKKALEEQSKISSIVFDNSAQAIMITDKDHKIISVNKAHMDIFGYSQEELCGKSTSILDSDYYGPGFFKRVTNMISRKGFWQGETLNRTKDGASIPFIVNITASKDEDNNILNYITILTDLLQKRELEGKIEYLVQYDHLTNLPNRALLIEKLEQAILTANSMGKKIAVLSFNIPQFETINSSIGYDGGDILLKDLASRFKEVIRASDILCRTSGDNFIFVISNITSEDDAVTVINKIFSIISEPFDIENLKININGNIGMSFYPDDGSTPFSLIKNSEIALYNARKENKKYIHYHPDMVRTIDETFKLSNRLQEAIDNEEFILYYQALISLKTGKIVGTEALIRWLHPELGIIPPMKFIPLAEKNGLIKPLGEWVIKESCRQMNMWKKHNLPDISISINVSAIQFQDQNLRNIIELELNNAGIDPSVVDLELTETMIMENTETSIAILKSLKELNIQLSIDDFGTGYSSLTYLKRFPVDKLKIDRSFVSKLSYDMDDLEDSAIIKAIIKLAKGLKLAVIAEGVETIDQLKFLVDCGCDMCQGFYFSKPVPPAEFEKLLIDNTFQKEIINL